MDKSLIDSIVPSLFSGAYNLLIGAGLSLDSKNDAGDNLMSGGQYLDYLAKGRLKSE